MTSQRNVLVCLCLLILLPLGRAQAGLLSTYDLDSLVYQSQGIVEADLTRVVATGYERHGTFKITSVLAGSFRAGDTLTVGGLDAYTVHYPLDADSPVPKPYSQDLKPGTHVILFLPPAGGKVTHYPVPSGLKIVQGGRVFGFSQVSNPGPYESQLPFDSSAPTLALFRSQVAAGLRQVEAWKPLLEAKPARKSVPALIRILRRREASTQTYYQIDLVAERACSQIAALHDPQVVDAAMDLLPGPLPWTLARGFGTPVGRDFLLRRIADPKTPFDHRMRLVGGVYEAGADYNSVLEPDPSHPLPSSGLPGNAPDNGHYLTRLAQTMADINAVNENPEQRLSRSLWDTLKGLMNFGPNGGATPGMQEDAAEAAALLKRKRLKL